MIKLLTPGKIAVGMVHVAALPGTPMHSLPMNDLIEQALSEANILLSAGFDAIMIENMHDVPYLNTQTGPEITAAMTAIAVELRKLSPKPMGIQILAAANKQALAVAHAAGFNFIRAEGFVFGHMADEGYIESCAGDLLRYRKAIGAENIAIMSDIKKKHSSHALTADVGLAETAKTAEYFLSDGIIITGSATGETAQPGDVQIAQQSCNLPVFVGSGISASNLHDYWPHAHGFIVGSSLKDNNNWKNMICPQKVREFMKVTENLRNK